jgi:hypothetical protein
VSHGRIINVQAGAGRYRAESSDGRLLAIGEVDASGRLKVTRGFAGSMQAPNEA